MFAILCKVLADSCSEKERDTNAFKSAKEIPSGTTKELSLLESFEKVSTKELRAAASWKEATPEAELSVNFEKIDDTSASEARSASVASTKLASSAIKDVKVWA